MRERCQKIREAEKEHFWERSKSREMRWMFFIDYFVTYNALCLSQPFSHMFSIHLPFNPFSVWRGTAYQEETGPEWSQDISTGTRIQMLSLYCTLLSAGTHPFGLDADCQDLPGDWGTQQGLLRAHSHCVAMKFRFLPRVVKWTPLCRR